MNVFNIRGRVIYSSFVPDGHSTTQIGEEGAFGCLLKDLKGFFPEGMFTPLFGGPGLWGVGGIENLF